MKMLSFDKMEKDKIYYNLEYLNDSSIKSIHKFIYLRDNYGLFCSTRLATKLYVSRFYSNIERSYEPHPDQILAKRHFIVSVFVAESLDLEEL